MPRIGARGSIYLLKEGQPLLDPYYTYMLNNKNAEKLIKHNLSNLDRIIRYLVSLPSELRMYAIPMDIFPRIDKYPDKFLVGISQSFTSIFTIARHFNIRLSLTADSASINCLETWAELLNTSGYYGYSQQKRDTFSIDIWDSSHIPNKKISDRLANLLTGRPHRPLLYNPSYSDEQCLELKREWVVTPKVMISSKKSYNFLKMQYPLALEWYKAGIDIEFDAACANIATTKLYNWIRRRLT